VEKSDGLAMVPEDRVQVRAANMSAQSFYRQLRFMPAVGSRG
jgi:hypothetical protein